MSWNGRKVALGLALMLASGSVRVCAAADTFLDRSKVQEAVPYGTTIESPPSKTDDEARKQHDGDRPRPTTPPVGTPPSTPSPEQGRDAGD